MRGVTQVVEFGNLSLLWLLLLLVIILVGQNMKL
jgi:hypothetical protein